MSAVLGSTVLHKTFMELVFLSFRDVPFEVNVLQHIVFKMCIMKYSFREADSVFT